MSHINGNTLASATISITIKIKRKTYTLLASIPTLPLFLSVVVPFFIHFAILASWDKGNKCKYVHTQHRHVLRAECIYFYTLVYKYVYGASTYVHRCSSTCTIFAVQAHTLTLFRFFSSSIYFMTLKLLILPLVTLIWFRLQGILK